MGSICIRTAVAGEEEGSTHGFVLGQWITADAGPVAGFRFTDKAGPQRLVGAALGRKRALVGRGVKVREQQPYLRQSATTPPPAPPLPPLLYVCL